MRRFCFLMLLTCLMISLAACAPTSSQPAASRGQDAPQARPTKTLVVATRGQINTVADKTLRDRGGATTAAALNLWNARLTLKDERDQPQPYLAQALPELNTDSWRVFPDGRMETTYRLKPGLTWHDGVPLTSDDFVFSWQVWATPEFGDSSTPPQSLMEEVLAPDPQTIVIRWTKPFAQAGELVGNFPPVPRHVLAEPFRTLSGEGFAAHPYWGEGFIGLGPYRVQGWENGVHIEGAAFDQHVLGRPAIDRLRLVSIPDPNTLVANLLAGAAHIAVDDSVRFEQGYLLQGQWSEGTVLFSPSQVRWTHVQFRPDLASPKGLLDVRFRRALAHAMDKQALIDGLLHGIGTPADTFVVPQSMYFTATDRVITRYPLDLRRADQLLNEAGYAKGPDGMYGSPSEGKIDLVLWAAQGTQNEAEIAIMSDSFKRIGIDARPYALPQALALDAQAAANFPGLHATSNINGFEPPFDRLRPDRIPTPENRWTGNNRGSWNNPTFGAMLADLDVALDRNERIRLTAEMLRLMSDEIPGYPLYFNFGVVAHSSDLQNILQGASNWSWNVHQWSWK